MQLTVDAVHNGVKLKLPTVPQFTKPTRKRSKEELIRHHRTQFSAVPMVNQPATFETYIIVYILPLCGSSDPWGYCDVTI